MDETSPNVDYSPYVVAVYGIAAVVMIGLIVWTVMRLAGAERRLREAEASGETDGELEP